MPQHAATIASLPAAFEVMKAMRAEGIDWGADHRAHGRAALIDILQAQMDDWIDGHLATMAAQEIADRRNGSYRRRLLTELGEIELCVPRTRKFSAGAVLRAYARRTAEIDRLILACFVLGVSTHKIAAALLPVLGRPVSAATVSRVAKSLDDQVAAFHRRRLKDQYRVLMLDGVVLSRKTGAGALRRPVLVALGIRPDQRKEIVDFRLAAAESEAEWERFLGDLITRGLDGQRLEMICIDGGKGLRAALPTAFPTIPVQRCWVHKIRNILQYVRVADKDAAKRDLHAIMNAPNRPLAQAAARAFADRWRKRCPRAVICLRRDLDALLTCFAYKTLAERKTVRSTNAIERRFREVRRRTRPMGVFQDRASMDRILFAVFAHLNHAQGVSSPFPLTQNS